MRNDRCIIDSCTKISHARGFCRMHYSRWERHGDPNSHARPVGTKQFTHKRTYESWHAMRARCYNHQRPEYVHYGAKGVTVCDRWSTFAGFYADMGDRPEGKTLDRIDVYGNYEPANCRWATPLEQAANRRSFSASSKINRRNKTGYPGVQITKTGVFEANISVKGRHVYIGRFQTAQEAAEQYLFALIDAGRM